MKRILTAGLLYAGMSMFFTGCSSLIVDMGTDYSRADQEAVSAVSTSDGGVRLEYEPGAETQTLPDYFEQNLENKFQNLTGQPAFQIADGHSAQSADLEDFQIGDLEADGTFVYAYVTCPEGQEDSGQIVHCAASYNYRSGELQVIHQTTFSRENDGEESFYIQTVEDGGLFVYDNGVGYLYGEGGRLTFQTDIETFVRNCFSRAYSVTAVKAMTDGNRRFYVELVVEKEPLTTLPDGTGDDGDADAEAEAVERELEEKVWELVLVYDFEELSSTLDQHNEAFDRQTELWKEMTEGEEFTEAPDAEADMETVRRRLADAWGGAFLPGLSDSKVYGWSGERRFQYEDDEEYICNFKAAPGSYQAYRNVAQNTALSLAFTPHNSRYYEVFGTTGSFQYYNRTKLSRSYIYVWYTEETSEDGSTEEVKHTEKRTQYIYRYRSRKTPLANAFLEGYWVLEDEDVSGISACLDGNILCAADGRLCWLLEDGRLVRTGISTEEEGITGAFEADGRTYLTRSETDRLLIAEQEWTDDHTVRQKNQWTLPYDSLAAAHAPGTEAYDRAFAQLNGDDLTMELIYGGGDYYTADMVLPAQLSVDGELAGWLGQRGVEVLGSGGSYSGFLLTSQAKGLVFYDTASQKGVRLAEGTWYRTWKQGNKFYSVGFASGDTAYNGLDLAFAHVYEYDLSQFYQESMEAAAEELRRQEEEAQEEEASRSLEGETEETGETVKDMLTEWEEQRSAQESTEVDLRPYVSEGETFDLEAYRAQESARQSEQASSEEERINQILN